MVKLFNTLTRKKEEFRPIDGKTAKIYSCGPTVYNTASIGNLRAYVFTDILKRTLRFAKFNVLDVMNTTDVGHLVSDADDGEDKIEKSARAQNTTPQEIAQKYTDQFFADCAKLNILRPKIVAPATKYIAEMIDFVKTLEKKGLTYITSDGVYFDSSRFPNYNKLSKTPIESNKAGARVDLGEKRNPHDFAVWKFVGDNSLQKWDFLSRAGCPGWHIECSAIARKELGDTFDIHTGGIDHIQIHHTNEIAQTESVTGKEMAKFWLHNEFITINGGKMSKSLGNVFTIDDLEKRGFNPLAFRYYCLTTHYRSILNFTWDGLAAAQTAYDNLVKALARHSTAEVVGVSPKLDTTALFDDLNTPVVLSKVWDLLKWPPSRKVYDVVIFLDAVLGLDLQRAVEEHLKPKNIPSAVIELANARQKVKVDKDYKKADELRNKIIEMGYSVIDTKDGFEIEKL